MSDRDKAGRIERCQSPVRQPSVLEAAAGKNNRCLSDSGGNVGNGKGKAIMKLRRHPANRHAGADISHMVNLSPLELRAFSKAGHDLMNRLVRKILESPDRYRHIELGANLPETYVDSQSYDSID